MNVYRTLARLARRLSGTPAPWAGNDLAGWHPHHTDPDGDVWAVTPPCGEGAWSLFAPGSPASGPFRYAGVTPAADHPASAAFGGDSGRLTLADVDAWVRPWVESASGGRVVELAEGWGAPYGPRGDLYEYVIYVRVVAAGAPDPAPYGVVRAPEAGLSALLAASPLGLPARLLFARPVLLAAFAVGVPAVAAKLATGAVWPTPALVGWLAYCAAGAAVSWRRLRAGRRGRSGVAGGA